MKKGYTLKEKTELTKDELEGILNSREYIEKYHHGKDCFKNSQLIHGEHFWLTEISIDNNNSLRRNQEPVEAIALLDSNGFIDFYEISKSGEKTNKRIKFYDKANNGLHVCKTKRQAQYMYNREIEDILSKMDSKIKAINDSKREFISLELELEDKIERND